MEYSISVQLLEIYNETIRDLLVSDAEARQQRSLPLVNFQRSGFNVPDAIQVAVGGTEEVLEVMARGARNRAVAETKMNDRSSRSHQVPCAALLARLGAGAGLTLELSVELSVGLSVGLSAGLSVAADLSTPADDTFVKHLGGIAWPQFDLCAVLQCYAVSCSVYTVLLLCSAVLRHLCRC